MKIYFLSSRPCALKLGGAYCGMTDGFERFVELSPKDHIFAEFIPENALPIAFFITEALRFSPPEHCEVYLLKDAVAVYAKDFPPNDFSLKLLLQERFLDNLVTVFRQGELQLSLETPKGFFVATLPPSFAPKSLKFAAGLFFVEGENSLLAYTAEGKCVFQERVNDYKIENDTLIATLPLSDSRGRYANCAWSLTPDGCFQTSFHILQLRHSADKTDDKTNAESDELSELILYAFLESVLIGADYTPFLSDGLKEKAPHLRAFLGDFLSVTLTDDKSTCGLVRKKKERLFELSYVTAEVVDGKIADLKL